MDIKLKILGIVASLILAALVFHLLRKKRLKESYSIFWGIVSTITIIIALWYNGVIIITELLNIESPINGIFFIAFFLLAILSLYFSVQFTQTSRKIKILAQENTILRGKINDLEKKINKLSGN
ncbi:hypothetical protein ES707_07063 [subsurface metagenome]